MDNTPLPLDQLHQHIRQQQAALETLRQEYQARHAQWQKLARRHEQLQTQLRQVETEMQTLGPATTPSSAASTPAATATPAEAFRPSGPFGAPVAVPQWNGQLRQLQLRGELVKAFTSPADEQEAILQVFQEQGWPKSIDNPLSRKKTKKVRHKQLENIVRRLNGNQRSRRLRFHVCDKGRKIWWEEILS
jgi:hypothetical protein